MSGESVRRWPVFWARARLGRLLAEVVVIAICLLWLSPFYLLVVSCFKTMPQIADSPFSLPTQLSAGAFVKAWRESHLGDYFQNSAIIASASVVGSVFVSSLAAYAFARFRFIGRQPLFFLFLGGVMLPLQATLIPLYQLMAQLGLLSTLHGMIMLAIAFTVPFGIFLLTGFFRSIPREIEEAAMIDGCSFFQIYWRIVMPLAAPGLATLATLEFIWFWNEYLLALTFLQTEAVRTVTMGVMVMAGTFQFDFSKLTAGTLISLAPTAAIYFLFQRYLIRGLTAGALKG